MASKPKLVSFPKRIEKFRFETELFLPSRSPGMRFALYKGLGRKRAFAKMWSGKNTHGSAKKLIEEGSILRTLSQAQSRLNIKDENASNKDVYIPQFITLFNDQKRIVLLSEYAVGNMLGVVKNLFHRAAFFKSVTYLRKLGKIMTINEKKLFPQRQAYMFILHYPYLVLRSIIFHTSFWREIVNGIPVFIKGIPLILKLGNQTVLSHRDLHGKNIIKNHGKLKIIDTTFMAFTVPEYDLLVSLSSNWHDHAYRKMVFDELSLLQGRKSQEHPYILSLMVYIATLFLSSNNFSSQKKINYRGFLAFAVTKSMLPNPKSFGLLRKLYYIIPSYIHSSIIYASGKKRTMKLPEKIGDYKRISPIATTKKYPYVLGMYRSKNGVEVVAKIWQGNRYSVHAFNLLHEADVCRVLDTIRLRIISLMPEALASIVTPAYHDCIVENGTIAVFMSKAQGEPITNVLTIEEQLKIYSRIISYLKFIGKNATPEERKVIGEKGFIYFIIIFPIILCVAWIRHITHTLEILRALYSFIFSLTSIYKDTTVLSHGDLHTDNILISEDKITLIDLEQTTFSMSGFDVFTTVSSLRSQEEFRSNIELGIWEQGKKSPEDAAKLSGIGTFISIFNLTNNLSPEHMKHYASILKTSNALGVLWEHSSEMRLRNLRLPTLWGKKST